MSIDCFTKHWQLNESVLNRFWWQIDCTKRKRWFSWFAKRDGNIWNHYNKIYHSFNSTYSVYRPNLFNADKIPLTLCSRASKSFAPSLFFSPAEVILSFSFFWREKNQTFHIKFNVLNIIACRLFKWSEAIWIKIFYLKKQMKFTETSQNESWK